MTKTPHPVTFEDFYGKYIEHLGSADRPSTYVAYCRTEADFTTDEFPRKFANHQTFKTVASRMRRRARQHNSTAQAA